MYTYFITFLYIEQILINSKFHYTSAQNDLINLMFDKCLMYSLDVHIVCLLDKMYWLDFFQFLDHLMYGSNWFRSLLFARVKMQNTKRPNVLGMHSDEYIASTFRVHWDVLYFAFSLGCLFAQIIYKANELTTEILLACFLFKHNNSIDALQITNGINSISHRRTRQSIF
jgi:hypothetical protein